MIKLGILLTNTGTPNAASKSAVRSYLREFLSDRRIVSLPRLIWLPILYGLILPFRAKKSMQLYQNIWTINGSPLRVHMHQIVTALQKKMPHVEMEVGMNYGQPSIKEGVSTLIQKGCTHLIVLPLFPQYSNTTTASSLDRVLLAIKSLNSSIEVDFISQYGENPNYIDALAKSVKQTWDQYGQSEHLLISFHGIPKRLVEKGDPYQQQTEMTAHLLAKALNLPSDKWTLCYQSKFGYDKWLNPSTQNLLTTLPSQGIKDIDVICPGFSVDCLETLEEIAITGHETFLASGGDTLRYIPALNATDYHVDLLSDILEKNILEKNISKK